MNRTVRGMLVALVASGISAGALADTESRQGTAPGQGATTPAPAQGHAHGGHGMMERHSRMGGAQHMAQAGSGGMPHGSMGQHGHRHSEESKPAR